MLDKLNEAASLISDMISGHPDSKKKRKKLDEEEDETKPKTADDATLRTQNAIRKATGGEEK